MKKTARLALIALAAIPALAACEPTPPEINVNTDLQLSEREFLDGGWVAGPDQQVNVMLVTEGDFKERCGSYGGYYYAVKGRLAHVCADVDY